MEITFGKITKTRKSKFFEIRANGEFIGECFAEPSKNARWGVQLALNSDEQGKDYEKIEAELCGIYSYVKNLKAAIRNCFERYDIIKNVKIEKDQLIEVYVKHDMTRHILLKGKKPINVVVSWNGLNLEALIIESAN